MLGPNLQTEATTTVRKPVAAVFRRWMRFEEFPRFIAGLQSVSAIAPGRSRWSARGPAGMPFEWESTITSEIAEKKITWESIDGKLTDHQGEVEFHPESDGRQTRVVVRGRSLAGGIVAALVPVSESQLQKFLERGLESFKEYVEREEE